MAYLIAGRMVKTMMLIFLYCIFAVQADIIKKTAIDGAWEYVYDVWFKSGDKGSR